MKSEMKFTPGPWVLMEVSQTYKVCTTDGETFVDRAHYLAGAPFVCEVNDDFAPAEAHTGNHYKPVRNPALCLANARLIASAPVMFEALQSFVELATDAKCIASVKWTTARDQARAALKLAGGQGV